MAETEFKVGDICRVREWDEMAAERGISNLGNVKGNPCFYPNMKFLCGELFTIKEVITNSYYKETIYTSVEGIEGGWFIAGYMLELFIPESVDEDFDFEFDLSELIG